MEYLGNRQYIVFIYIMSTVKTTAVSSTLDCADDVAPVEDETPVKQLSNFDNNIPQQANGLIVEWLLSGILSTHQMTNLVKRRKYIFQFWKTNICEKLKNPLQTSKEFEICTWKWPVPTRLEHTLHKVSRKSNLVGESRIICIQLLHKTKTKWIPNNRTKFNPRFAGVGVSFNCADSPYERKG